MHTACTFIIFYAYTFFKYMSFQNSVHTACMHTLTCTHTHSYIRTMGLKKRFFERGFQGRFERTDRDRMTDRNRELVSEIRCPISTFWRPVTLLQHAGVLWCFLNSNMDCKIFNVLMWHFCMRIHYTRVKSADNLTPEESQGGCKA